MPSSVSDVIAAEDLGNGGILSMVLEQWCSDW